MSDFLSSGKGWPLSIRRRRPEVRLGWRSQKPVGAVGMVAAPTSPTMPKITADQHPRFELIPFLAATSASGN